MAINIDQQIAANQQRQQFINQFILTTAQQIYAGILAQDDTGEIDRRQAAVYAMGSAPFLAEAAGMITIPEEKVNAQSSEAKEEEGS